MKKKIFSMLLSLAVIFAMIPAATTTAFAVDDQEGIIDEIEIEGFQYPVPGQILKDNIKDLSVVENEKYSLKEVHWDVESGESPEEDDVFNTEPDYYLEITLKPAEGYTIDNESAVRVNGKEYSAKVIGQGNYTDRETGEDVHYVDLGYYKASVITDENFRNCLLGDNEINTNGDNELSDEEIAKAESISIHSENIDTLQGIEYFTNLKNLFIEDTNISTLDLSKNTQLVSVDVSNNNSLNSIILGNQDNLKGLRCDTDSLETIDVTGCPALEYLTCYDEEHNLKHLDVTKNTNLVFLFVNGDGMDPIDVRNCKGESFSFYADDNKIEGEGNLWYVGNHLDARGENFKAPILFLTKEQLEEYNENKAKPGPIGLPMEEYNQDVILHAEHVLDNGTITKDPTCTENGEIIYKCINCDYSKSETLDKLAHEMGEGVVTKDATCENEGTKEYSCKNCHKVIKTEAIPKKDHAYGDKTVKKATLTANGKITQKCSACGTVKTVSTIYYPKTFTAANAVYTGKTVKPAITVKDSKGNKISSTNYSLGSGSSKIGKHSIKITFKNNYSGSKTISYKVVPKKATVKSATPGKKKMTVKAGTKVSSTGGTYYQIQYRVKGTTTWKSTTTKSQSKTIKSLKKGKKYEVKIRAYKTVSKTKYYGEWSAIKTTNKIK